MGTKIYTKIGDHGESALYSGQRVSKNHERLEAYGTLDELNAAIGWALSHLPKQKKLSTLTTSLSEIQNQLFVIGSHLACDSEEFKVRLPKIKTSAIKDLENIIDQWSDQLPELKEFILPAGHPAAAGLHFSRTVCRRAERRLVTLLQKTSLDSQILIYLNRLGDFLFVAARYANWILKAPEVKWKK